MENVRPRIVVVDRYRGNFWDKVKLRWGALLQTEVGQPVPRVEHFSWDDSFDDVVVMDSLISEGDVVLVRRRRS